MVIDNQKGEEDNTAFQCVFRAIGTMKRTNKEDEENEDNAVNDDTVDYQHLFNYLLYFTLMVCYHWT